MSKTVRHAEHGAGKLCQGQTDTTVMRRIIEESDPPAQPSRAISVFR
jgi:hypothetical protein